MHMYTTYYALIPPASISAFFFLSQTLMLSERERRQLSHYLMLEACEALYNATEILGDERISLDLLPWTGAARCHRKTAEVPRVLLC